MSLLSVLRERLYPGLSSMGVSARNGTVRFYVSVNKLMEENSTVLDFGAGRGAAAAQQDAWLRDLIRLKPKCLKRVGLDIDPVVTSNMLLDEAHVLTSDCQRLPVASEMFDVVLADWVVEHLEDPLSVFEEIHRVLRPGGWFCARTGNVYHYSYALARLLSKSRYEAPLLARVQPGRVEDDVFPKVFRANSSRVLRQTLAGAGFDRVLIHHWEPEPAYLNFHPLALVLGALYERLASVGVLPSATLLVFAQKRASWIAAQATDE